METFNLKSNNQASAYFALASVSYLKDLFITRLKCQSLLLMCKTFGSKHVITHRAMCSQTYYFFSMLFTSPGMFTCIKLGNRCAADALWMASERCTVGLNWHCPLGSVGACCSLRLLSPVPDKPAPPESWVQTFPVPQGFRAASHPCVTASVLRWRCALNPQGLG